MKLIELRLRISNLADPQGELPVAQNPDLFIRALATKARAEFH